MLRGVVVFVVVVVSSAFSVVVFIVVVVSSAFSVLYSVSIGCFYLTILSGC
jgi:hypothetical protein